MPLDRSAFVIGHDLSCKPSPAEPPEQVGMWTGRDQMRMQDRVHLVLDPRAVPDNLVAARYQPPEALGIGIGQPDLRQKVGCPQRCQHAGVDLVRFDVRVRD